MTLYSPGTLIQARRRLWRVDAQEGSVLHVTAVDASTERARLYLPVESVKPGQLPRPDANLIGYPQAQELMLRAFRLSMIHSTAPLMALQRSRAIPVPYQLVPLVMALEQPRVRLLIADDIGLGKTIEAGLVISELMARGLVRRVLVVCPASLRQQWREALDYFFHLDARIFSRTHRRLLERDLPAGANPWEFHNAFIVSIDYAKAPEIKNQILEVPWDLVVIDEAHQLAKPHQSGPDQRVKMDRWELGKALAFAPRIPNLLLLTATPHNGYTDSFASLLRLLDVSAVSGPDHAPTIHRAVTLRHIVQRRRQDVEEWILTANGKGGTFPERDQDEVVIPPSAQEMEVINAVQNYGELILEHARGAQAQIQTLAGWTVLHLHKRGLSSPAALRESLKNRRAALEQRLQGLTEEDAGLPFEAARANVLDEDPGELLDEEEVVNRSEKVTPGNPQSLKAELSALEQVESLAGRVTPARDSKLQHLLRNLLRPMLARRHKAIIFTRYRDTMTYLAEQLSRHDLFQHAQVVTLDGSLNEIQRQERFTAFEKARDAVLVATDAISEGVNLQYLASQIIHYELPWNPNRLEQRNGRVDRFGQPEKTVVIRTLVMDETLDAAILQVMVKKARQIRQDYGFSPPYFGDEVNVVDFIMEHGLGIQLGPRQMSLFEQFAEDRGAVQDPFDEDLLQRIQGESFYGQTDISLNLVEEQMRQVREAVGSPAEVEAFVRSGLDRLLCAVEEKPNGLLRIHLAHPELRLPGLGEFLDRATFDPERGKGHPEIDVLDLGHPLVRRLLDLLKRETFQPDSAPGERLTYGRTAVMLTRDIPETTALYTLLVRFVTGGTSTGQPHQVMEDLVTLALPVYGDIPLPPSEAARLIHTQPAPGRLSDAEAREVLADAINRDDLPTHVDAAIAARKAALVEERAALRQALNRPAEWAQGIEELSVGSWDLLAVKVLWPT